MRKFVIYIGLLVCVITVQAQDPETGLYRSFFGEESSSWNGVTEYWDCPLENHLLRLGNDTIIDGTVYRKIEYSHIIWDNGYLEIRHQESDFYLREEHMTGKLWCRFLDDNHDFIIADMSLSLYDTISLPDRNQNYPRPLTESVLYHVTDTSTTEYGRTIILESLSGRHRTIEFIEGVGGTNLFDCIKFPAFTSQLVCYHKDGNLIYHNTTDTRWPEEDCVIYSSIAGINNQASLIIWPNPCEDWFMIKSDHILVAELYDIMGHGIIENIVPYKKIDTGDLPRGVYLLRVKLNGSIITKKIVIK